MELTRLIRQFQPETARRIQPRPYINHSVEFKGLFTAEERARVLDDVGLNVFYFPSEMITGCDLLSDSGTTTMTNDQWAALHQGDEAYGSNRGYFRLREVIRETFGEEYFSDAPGLAPNAFLFHQGRACEDALFSALGRLGSGLVIPSNGHFDTTQANIEGNRIAAVNLFSPELQNPASDGRFKGNMDTKRLRALLETSGGRVPVVYLTITNNTGGGQPVSLANVREVSEIAHGYGLPLMLDACRFAENAWFIKQYESGQQNRAIIDIVREVFSHADGFTISFKKDGIVNMGGGLFFRQGGLFLKQYPHLADEITNHQITKEGHPTYGGLSGRDIMALAVGLGIAVKDAYLAWRIQQIERFGRFMQEQGLPILTPTGGHAVYLDMNRFFAGTRIRPEDFGGISITALLLAGYGHRGCELGHFAFGSYDPATGKEAFPEVNFVRLAVPRLRYEDADLASVAESLRLLYDERDRIPGVEVTFGKELALRHFKARFRFKESAVGCS
ncbi:MAG: tryptophanase [Candidatus Zixiibacteriota bacterium]|nr:MAG: tryptophanase [candidate division Zixibacteria bacterium]